MSAKKSFWELKISNHEKYEESDKFFEISSWNKHNPYQDYSQIPNTCCFLFNMQIKYTTTNFKFTHAFLDVTPNQNQNLKYIANIPNVSANLIVEISNCLYLIQGQNIGTTIQILVNKIFNQYSGIRLHLIKKIVLSARDNSILTHFDEGITQILQLPEPHQLLVGVATSESWCQTAAHQINSAKIYLIDIFQGIIDVYDGFSSNKDASPLFYQLHNSEMLFCILFRDIESELYDPTVYFFDCRNKISQLGKFKLDNIDGKRLNCITHNKNNDYLAYIFFSNRSNILKLRVYDFFRKELILELEYPNQKKVSYYGLLFKGFFCKNENSDWITTIDLSGRPFRISLKTKEIVKLVTNKTFMLISSNFSIQNEKAITIQYQLLKQLKNMGTSKRDKFVIFDLTSFKDPAELNMEIIFKTQEQKVISANRLVHLNRNK